jgi:dTDP-4-amino-4,6-dideoxygalactose transaminase
MTAVLATSPSIAAAEKAVAQWFGRECAVLVGSGTAAITLLLEALAPPRGSRVLYPDTICDTAVNGAVCAGLEPQFADVDRATATLAAGLPAAVDRARVAAVMPTHIFGHLADIRKPVEQGLSADCAVIEDAAQGYGAVLRGDKVGALAPYSIISFGRGKLLDLGSGGALLTDDPVLAREAERVRTSWPGSQNSASERQAFMEACFRARKTAADGTWPAERDRLMRRHRHAYVFQIESHQAERIGAAVGDIGRLADQRRHAAASLQSAMLEGEQRWPDKVKTFAVADGAVLWRFTFLVEPPHRKSIVDALRRAGLQVSTLFQPMHRQYEWPDDEFPEACALADRLINIVFEGAAETGAGDVLRNCLNECFGN